MFLTSLESKDLVSTAVLMPQLRGRVALPEKSVTEVDFCSCHRTSVGKWSSLLPPASECGGSLENPWILPRAVCGTRGCYL